MPPFWRSITLVGLRPHPSLLLLMLCLRRALDPTFQLLLLLPSADLFQPFLTSPVLVVVSHSIGFYWHFWVLLFCRFLVLREMRIPTHRCVFVRIYLSLRRMRFCVRIYVYSYASTTIFGDGRFRNIGAHHARTHHHPRTHAPHPNSGSLLGHAR